MKKKNLSIIILASVILIIALIMWDFLGKQPGKRGANPYEYSVDEYKSVDSSLIHYRETRNISMGDHHPSGFCIFNDEIYITGENFLQLIRPDGVQILFQNLADTGRCIKANEDYIFIGFRDHIARFDRSGNLIDTWPGAGEKTILTSLAIKGDHLYAADAGNRRVLRYDLNGDLLSEFEGKSNDETGHGFIIPSANFDMAVNSFDELWVVNPGLHSLENYTDEGNMRGFWKKTSMGVDGFSGCCNPAHIAVLNDGSFVTSEKGMVRIKVHDASGELISVVAPPSKFKEEGKAPDVAVDSQGKIYALDFDKNRIRIFEKLPS